MTNYNGIAKEYQASKLQPCRTHIERSTRLRLTDGVRGARTLDLPGAEHRCCDAEQSLGPFPEPGVKLIPAHHTPFRERDGRVELHREDPRRRGRRGWGGWSLGVSGCHGGLMDCRAPCGGNLQPYDRGALVRHGVIRIGRPTALRHVSAEAAALRSDCATLRVPRGVWFLESRDPPEVLSCQTSRPIPGPIF